MPLTTDFRIIWTGDHADIPADFSRDISFDDRYIQGSDDPSNYSGPTNGGNATHTHVIDQHSHNGDVHIHTVESDIIAGSSDNYENLGAATLIPRRKHQHTSISSFSEEVVYQDNNQNLGNTVNHPFHVIVIILKPDDNSQEIPDTAIAFIDNSDIPAGYELTATYRTQMFKTAITDGDGSGFAGALRHSHAASGSHNHESNLHSHFSISGPTGTSLGLEPIGLPSTGGSALLIHHTLLLQDAVTPATNLTGAATDNTSNVPKRRALLGVRNTSGSASTPDNIITLYVGDVTAGLPEGWILCDGSNFTPDMTDRQVVIADIQTIGKADGSNEHIHPTYAHSHTVGFSLHNHTVAETDITTDYPLEGGPRTSLAATPTHSHTWTIGSSTTTPTQNSAPDTSSTDKRYLYRNVVFIKKSPGNTVHIDGSAQLNGLSSIAA